MSTTSDRPCSTSFGLVKSLEAAVARFSPPAGTGPAISVTVVGASDLPAAVEVAAYRIAVEALTNVIKHARASRCDLLLALTDTLTLQITDDGVGMPEKPGPVSGCSQCGNASKSWVEPSRSRISAAAEPGSTPKSRSPRHEPRTSDGDHRR